MKTTFDCNVWPDPEFKAQADLCPLWSLADILTSPRHVRFTPDIGHSADELARLLFAINGHEARNPELDTR
jgi:hypothetical protein